MASVAVILHLKILFSKIFLTKELHRNQTDYLYIAVY